MLHHLVHGYVQTSTDILIVGDTQVYEIDKGIEHRNLEFFYENTVDQVEN